MIVPSELKISPSEAACTVIRINDTMNVWLETTETSMIDTTKGKNKRFDELNAMQPEERWQRRARYAKGTRKTYTTRTEIRRTTEKRT